MTNGHTPGPWQVTEESGTYITGDRTLIGKVYGANEYNGPEDGVAEANARLMAAAPDLLAALRCLVGALERAGYNGNVLSDARAAIARAEGQK